MRSDMLQVQDLKSYIMDRCGVDVEGLVVARAKRAFNDITIALLDQSQGLLKPTSYTPLEGQSFFVAAFADDADYRHASTFDKTPMCAAIKKVTQIVTCSFNTVLKPVAEASDMVLEPSAPHANKCLHVNVTDLLGRLKHRMAAAVGVAPDCLRLYRKTGSGASESKKELLKLEVCQSICLFVCLGSWWWRVLARCRRAPLVSDRHPLGFSPIPQNVISCTTSSGASAAHSSKRTCLWGAWLSVGAACF